MGLTNNSRLKRSNVVGIGGTFFVECYDKYGNKKWEENFNNAWTNAGLLWLMQRSFKDSKPSDLTFYMGLIDTGASLANSDVMNSHAGWTENINYSETSRPLWDNADPTESAGIVSSLNSVRTEFTCDTNSQTINGAFLTSGSAKSGTAGTLLVTGSFASEQELNDDDVLKVQYTLKAQKKV